jgi:hypothetical protein
MQGHFHGAPDIAAFYQWEWALIIIATNSAGLTLFEFFLLQLVE